MANEPSILGRSKVETENKGDRNWLVLIIVAFLLGLIFLDISLLLSVSLSPGQWFLIIVGIPLWATLLAWVTRIFVRSRRFYCATPACAITGQKYVFMPKGNQWICTQCKRPLETQVSRFPQRQQPLIDTSSYSGRLGDTYLGGVAGLRIYRFKGRGQVNWVSDYRNPWGYGIYFTDNHLIGVSYTKYLSQAYYPGWILSIAWPGILALSLAYFALTHTQELPLWWIPIFPISFFVCMIMSFVFLLYISPKRASSQIDRIQVNSIGDLEPTRKDVILRRDEISEINISGTKVYDPGHGSSPGSIISVSSKTRQPVIFVTTNKEKFKQLSKLVQDFARGEPPISLTAN